MDLMGKRSCFLIFSQFKKSRVITGGPVLLEGYLGAPRLSKGCREREKGGSIDGAGGRIVEEAKEGNAENKRGAEASTLDAMPKLCGKRKERKKSRKRNCAAQESR
jgi:hypothetical protein